MRLGSSQTFGQDDYSEGDIIVFETATTTQAVEVQQKSDNIKKGRSGFDGEVVEVIRAESHREVGDLVFGYDSQITEVRG